MTQYLLSVWHDGSELDPETGGYATKEEMQAAYEATGKFNDEIAASGNLVFGGGLHMPDTASVVNNVTGDLVITDGPFAESKEQLGGFWIIRANDLDEAVAIAARGSIACKNPVEVRPFQGDTPDTVA
ncbi:MAG: hypothetical protein QOJ00_2779 [Actinomycetota bacterium]